MWTPRKVTLQNLSFFVAFSASPLLGANYPNPNIGLNFFTVGTRHYSAAGKCHIPIIHFSAATPPLVICVATKRARDSEGIGVEDNIASLDLVEGRDYVHFA
jgi:hypothetical protein